jgi:hypothetical protein
VLIGRKPWVSQFKWSDKQARREPDVEWAFQWRLPKAAIAQFTPDSLPAIRGHPILTRPDSPSSADYPDGLISLGRAFDVADQALAQARFARMLVEILILLPETPVFLLLLILRHEQDCSTKWFGVSRLG